MGGGSCNRSFVTGIGMPRDANAWIVSENALEPHAHFRRAVGDYYLSRMKRVADANSTAMVKGDPRCSTRNVEQCIEYRPIGDSIASIFHSFSFAER